VGWEIGSIEDVIESQLCLGCGICASVENERYSMEDSVTFGRRPYVKEGAPKETGEAFLLCPGHHLEHTFDLTSAKYQTDLLEGWGPILGVWEGYATDKKVRFQGSSGGVATALSHWAINKGGFSGILHTAASESIPFLNETIYSTKSKDLGKAAGSRYAPSSPCEKLNLITQFPDSSVLIGKPCDIASASKLSKIDPQIEAKLGLTIGFFCAGTPSTKGNLDLLEKVGIKHTDKLISVRYRGNGWPGRWVASYLEKDGIEKKKALSYSESWGFLQKHRQWRCYICPDHTGEFADIAVGDPWYRDIEPGEPGKSLIIARTQRGLDAILAATATGYVTLEKRDNSLLPRSQPNLLKTRGTLWARLIVLKIFGAAVPDYKGFNLFKYWLSELSFKEKLQSFYGTIKRVYKKKLRKRISIKD